MSDEWINALKYLSDEEQAAVMRMQGAAGDYPNKSEPFFKDLAAVLASLGTLQAALAAAERRNAELVIANKEVADMNGDLIELLVSRPEVSNCNTLGYVEWDKQVRAALNRLEE